MKKILLIAVVLLMTSALAFAGGGSDKGGAKAGGSGEPPFIVDLSTMTQVATTASPDKIGAPVPGLRNPTAITKNWHDVMFLFPEDMPDVTKYSRVTVTLKYYDKDGKLLVPKDSMAMCSMLYGTDANWRADAGGNTIFKEFNIGGFSGMLHKERGLRISLSKNPGALLAQRAQDANCAFIELSGIIFHNGDFKFTEEQPEGEGPEGS